MFADDYFEKEENQKIFVKININLRISIWNIFLLKKFNLNLLSNSPEMFKNIIMFQKFVNSLINLKVVCRFNFIVKKIGVRRFAKGFHQTFWRCIIQIFYWLNSRSFIIIWLTWVKYDRKYKCKAWCVDIDPTLIWNSYAWSYSCYISPYSQRNSISKPRIIWFGWWICKRKVI